MTYRYLHRMVKLCLDIASLVEEGHTLRMLLESDLNAGSAVISMIMRGGVKDIVDLQDELARTKGQIEFFKDDKETLKAFRTTFGCDDPGDFSDEELEQIKALVKKIQEEQE